MKKNTPAGVKVSEEFGEFGAAMERLSKKRRKTRRRMKR